MAGKKEKGKAKTKVRILPRADKAQTFEQALAATNKQFAQTFAKLADPDYKFKTKKTNKKRILPRPDRARSFDESLAAAHKQYGWTFAKLAEYGD